MLYLKYFLNKRALPQQFFNCCCLFQDNLQINQNITKEIHIEITTCFSNCTMAKMSKA